jgi:SAM-dependent methyltransferase
MTPEGPESHYDQPVPEYSPLAEPRHAADDGPDDFGLPPTDWSQPTLTQPDEDDPVVDVPAPATRLPRRPRMHYEQGSVAGRHPVVIERAADVALAAMAIPLRVLDVGCGDGHLLAELILRVPHAELYVGVDPVPDVITAEQRAAEPRLSVVRASAEALPFPDASFDLVMATMSFAYWIDQRAGAAELARVVSDNGRVVLVESGKGGRSGRNRARSVRDITHTLEAAGLQVERVETLHRSMLGGPSARAFIASL